MKLLTKIQTWSSILFYSPCLCFHLIIKKIICKKLPDVRNDIIIDIGGIRFPINLKDYGSNHLKAYLSNLYNQSYEPFTRYLIETILKPGDVFYDVGANLGYFSAIAANVVGHNGEIFCFDIDPRCMDNLNKFKNMNLDYQIYPKNIALGCKNEQINLELAENHTWNSIHQSNNINKPGCIHNLYMSTLSSFIISNKLRMPKLIKIDVEGAEYAVLSGLSDILKQKTNNPYIIMEISPYENNVSLIFKLIDELGYKIMSTVPPFHVIKIVDIVTFTNVLLKPIE